jgi:hypothetical protein
MNLVQFLRGENQKHLNTWDENLIYVQQCYDRAVHTSTGKSHFETCFGYLPPSPLDVVYGQQGGVREELTRNTLKGFFFFVREDHANLFAST